MLARINYGGRDNARHLIPWTGDMVKSWIAPYSRISEINVEKEKNSKKSIFAFYQELIALRKREKCITEGVYELVELNEERYVFRRKHLNQSITVVCNFEKESSFDMALNGVELLSNIPIKKGVLLPYQIVVYKTNEY